MEPRICGQIGTGRQASKRDLLRGKGGFEFGARGEGFALQKDDGDAERLVVVELDAQRLKQAGRAEWRS